jgi:hypothetical protein
MMTKEQFLEQAYTPLLASLRSDAKGNWGVMNAQQMVEHMTDSVLMAITEEPVQCITPEERIPAMQAFVMSEKPFKENTPNAQLPAIPPPPRFAQMEESVMELQQALNAFLSKYRSNPELKVVNPFFGTLDFEMWTALLHKHAWHHLRQFGINDTNE